MAEALTPKIVRCDQETLDMLKELCRRERLKEAQVFRMAIREKHLRDCGDDVAKKRRK